MYEKRIYRNLIDRGARKFFRIAVKETDLYVHTDQNLEKITQELILQYRGYIEAYINQYPKFAESLTPWHVNAPAPLIIQDMAKAGLKANVGPMAAVAGAVAEYVGRDLLKYSKEVIVENGGDIFLKTNEPVKIAVFAGKSPLSQKIGVYLDSTKPVSICTSSGTIGHSLSMGKADAVCVVSDSCCLADAAATSIANQVKSKLDIEKAIDFSKQINDVKGLIIIIQDKIGIWGEIELVPVG